MKQSKAQILREYGPFPGTERIHGVTFDGKHGWYATDNTLDAFDPVTGNRIRSIKVTAHAGTAFDGKYLFQIADDRIQKIDPPSGHVLLTIPAPQGGCSVLAWAEGMLWVGQYHNRKIHQVDPGSGAVVRVIDSDRQVTGVTWVDRVLWHATWEGDKSELRRLDPEQGTVHESIELPEGMGMSGLESDGADRFYCGGGASGKVRAAHRPGRKRSTN